MSKVLVEQSSTYSSCPPHLLRHPDRTDGPVLDEQNAQLRDRVEDELRRGRVAAAVELSRERVELSSTWLLAPHVLHTMGRMTLSQYYWALHGNRGPSWKPTRLSVYY